MQILAVALYGMVDLLTFRRSIHATGYHTHTGKWEGRGIHGKIGYRIECTTQQAAMIREVVSSTVDMNAELHVCKVIWPFQYWGRGSAADNYQKPHPHSCKHLGSQPRR